MSSDKQKINLDRFLTYETVVPGHLHAQMLDSDENLKISLGFDQYGEPISTLKSNFDQASLHGLLRRLYFLGIPLISVHCLDIEKSDE